jgi:hypothetical protein
MVLHARLAIMNRGELPEILLSQALSFGRNAPGLAFGANSVMPTASGGAVAVPPQEVRMLELEMPFRVNELFAWRTNPGLFEGLKAHFGVALYVLDSEGDQISTYLPLGEIWFKDDGSIAQTSGRRATASLLGDAKGSVRWQASSEN